MKKILMVMVDGFGIPAEGWRGSIYGRHCSEGFLGLLEGCSVPLDCQMGVPGTPQSATGQTALFTGFNAAAEVNMHVQGFPGPSLRKLISRRNIFGTISASGHRAAFSNAYVRFTIAELMCKKLASVTTVMTGISGVLERGRDCLVAGDAVYHDITRASLPKKYDVPEISPEQAAEDLLKICAANDFTLFEYFLTDHAGHKLDQNMLSQALSNLSRFFCHIIDNSKDSLAVVLTSDHGNCEDITSKHHTTNPVPFFSLGFGMPQAPPLRIEQVFAFLRDYMRS
ncbi:MAG: hypothetical protein JW808_00210 [Victivallales bacterium]|nr:hypothetical protein [Victivallales bacterium]